MKVLIIGGAGMVGRKLAERLAKDGALAGKAISKLTLYDVVPGAVPAEAKAPVAILTGDLPAAGEADKLLADQPDVIFHLAAIVSGEAEQDFDKGYRINMDGTRSVLEAVRATGYVPRLLCWIVRAQIGEIRLKLGIKPSQLRGPLRIVIGVWHDSLFLPLRISGAYPTKGVETVNHVTGVGPEAGPFTCARNHARNGQRIR
jgi:nucleoside-diphosphate-sugar epimerase